MPIYEYECLECGKTTEALQKFSDPPLGQCGHCSGEMRKMVSMSAFHLKGSGWYVTDYSGKKQENGKQAETAKPEASSATSSTSESS